MANGVFGVHQPLQMTTPMGAATAAAREGAAEQRLESQERRLQEQAQRSEGQDRRLQETHQARQRQGQFEQVRAEKAAETEDYWEQLKRSEHERDRKMAELEGLSGLYNRSYDILTMGPGGGKLAASGFANYHRFSGGSFDNDSEPVNLIPGRDDKTGAPGYYGYDLDNQPVTVRGEHFFVPHGRKQDTTTAQDNLGKYELREGRWVLVGPPSPEMVKKPADVGAIPQGQRLVKTQEGYELQDIPGGPRAQKKQEMGAKEKTQRKLTAQRTLLVARDVSRAINYIEQGGTFLPAAGAIAHYTKTIPFFESFRLEETLKSLVARVGFDELQSMRQSSPTGGALGQISDRENLLLQAAKGSLVVGQDPAVLKENLIQIKELYLDAYFGTDAERQQAVAEGRMSQEEAANLARERESIKFDDLGRLLDPSAVIPEEGLPKSKQPDPQASQQSGQQQDAPQQALDYLRANPQAIDQFVQKYGYRPEGF